INEPLLDWERNFAAVLDGAKGHKDDDYDDPELRMEETRQSIKILPARPIKESEYADTRYLKVAMDTPLPLDTRTSIPIGQQTWNTQTRLERVDKPISKDIRSQNIKGDTSIRKNKIPLPPPRPLITLPKQYQPLPPEPENCRPPLAQRHTFLEVQRMPSQISLRDLSEPY
uniref:Cytokine dependent hematopoietic cell linker n=1 Tax=Macaca nemestrina TaxID=9545 RepID=A0A2K6BQY7_MACNE